MAANPYGRRRSARLNRMSELENVPPLKDTDQKHVNLVEEDKPFSFNRMFGSVLEGERVSGPKVNSNDVDLDRKLQGEVEKAILEKASAQLEEETEAKFATEMEKIPSLNIKDMSLDLELEELDVADYKEALDELSENPTNTEIGKGLEPYNLDDVEVPSTRGKYDVNPTSITKLLVDAITIQQSDPETLPDPERECGAIVNALIRYVSRVPPSESIQLYQISSTKKRAFMDPEEDDDYIPSSSRKKKSKSWGHVAELGGSKLKQLLASSEAKKAFERKMTAIMAASLEVDPYNWAMCEVGYTLAFWIAALYDKVQKVSNITDLPSQLLTGREHFLELHNLVYDECDVRTKL